MNLWIGLGAPARVGMSGVRVSAPQTTRRALELALTAVGLGALGHMMGGASISPVIILPALIPVLMLARVLARRELRSGVLVAVLIAGQLWVHTLASLTGHHAATNNSSMLLGHAIATVAAVALLRRREAVRWANARRKAITAYIVGLLRTGNIVLPAAPRLALVPSFAHVTLPNCLIIGESVVLRGPPRWGIR